ncbi:MAG: hypothetical protein PHV39_03465 [Methanomicrobium sp.]|nr:hypothetical protein [Methanomicrobium sp.]
MAEKDVRRRRLISPPKCFLATATAFLGEVALTQTLTGKPCSLYGEGTVQ